MGNEQNLFNQKCVIDEQINVAGEQNTVNVNKYYDRTELQLNESIQFHLPKLIKSFRGRDAELQTLNKWFFADKQKLAVICGCPGYGKTELAKQFVQQCRGDVAHVVWMDAETPDKLLRSFRDLARLLRVPDVDDVTQMDLVYRLLKSKPTVVVFDNATCRKDIVGFEPDSADCFCLVTSHVQDWGDDVPSLPLAPLSTSAALDVLRAVLLERFQEADVPLYRRLASLLSCVPLALQVAAAYVRQECDDLGEHFRLAEYVQRLQVPSEQVLDQPLPDSSANTYERTFLNAMQISLNKIQNSAHKHARLACDVLHICAYLDSENVLHSDLLNIPYLKELLTDRNPTNELKRACALLRNYLFISCAKDQISLHRLIQSSVVLNQNYIFQNNHNRFYIACLEFLLFNTENSHRQSILKYAEYHLNTFKYFYSKYKTKILSDIRFFSHIITANCKIYLLEILEDLGNAAVETINTRYLLHEAVTSQQLEILDLLLAYNPDVDLHNEQEETCLHLATYKADLPAVQKLVSHNADVNAIGGQNLTVLHRLVYKAGTTDALPTLRYLVAAGGRPDAVGWRRMTLLHVAALGHSADLVPHLVGELQQDLDARDDSGQTPLYKVCEVSGVDRARVLRTAARLVELGASLDSVDAWGRTPVEHARCCGLEYLAAYLENPTQTLRHLQMSHVHASDLLLASVTSGDVETLGRQLDALGERAAHTAGECLLLHAAARHSQRAALRLLLARGVAVDRRDDSRNTALFDAAWELRPHVMRDLVAYGADVNAANARGETVLHALVGGAGLVRRAGREASACEALRWLVSLGARADAATLGGWTLLHEAAWALSAGVARCLLAEHGADVHATDRQGRTPLFSVVPGLLFWQVGEARALRSAACLLAAGARPDARDARGMTAGQVAQEKNLQGFAAFLDESASSVSEDSRDVEDPCKSSRGPVCSFPSSYRT